MKANLGHILEVDKDPPPPWLIPGLICRGTFTVLAGEAGAGKSFLSYRLGLALATGRDFLTFPTQPHRVLYFDDENSLPDSDHYLRVNYRGLGKPDMGLLSQNFRLERFSLSEAGISWNILAKKIAKEFQPDLVIIDTAVACCVVKDENDNAEAVQTIKSLRTIAHQSGPHCSMWVLKHAKLDSERGRWIVRGAKAWVSATDATLVHSVYKGPELASGYRTTQLNPEKFRAYSLKQGLILHPEVTEGPEGVTVKLKANLKKSKVESEVTDES